MDHHLTVAQEQRGALYVARCTCGWIGPSRDTWSSAHLSGALHVWYARRGLIPPADATEASTRG